MINLQDKVALVTGGSRGIGAAIVKKLASQGATVVINYLFDEEEAKELLAEVEAAGGKGMIVLGDVSDFESAKQMMEATYNEFGRLDVLVNNAGITKDSLMMRMSEEDFDQVINVNLKGTWNTIKHSTKRFMKQRSGSIINISSVVGLMGNPGQVNYVASKAGIIGLTKTLAKEFGPRGVTVNAIAPGFIQTPMTDVLSEEVKDAMLQSIPLNYFGSPEDIANTVAFLASDEAKYITGQVISVNGGMI